MTKMTLADVTKTIEDDAINYLNTLPLRCLIAAVDGRIDLNDIARRLLEFQGFPMEEDQ